VKQENRKRVLVIDDNATLVVVLKDFLEFKGFEVATAESGEEGLEKLSGWKPDLILLDIAMPGMGGIGFLKRIMSGDGVLQYPVLVFTARATTKDFFEAIAVDGFVAKPCDKNELVDRMHEILSREAPSAGKKTARAAKTAMICEDQEDLAGRLAEAFRSGGYEVEVVAAGPQLVEKAALCPPSVIVIKQILPRMNGSAVAWLLHAMPRTQSVPVVLYDGSVAADEEGAAAYRRPDSGVKRYLATEDPAQLLKAANDVLRRGRGA
jgi:CheY-like chemotaxis protein